MRRAGARRPGPRSARARRGHGHHGECGARPGGRRGPGLALRRRQLRPGARRCGSARSVPAGPGGPRFPGGIAAVRGCRGRPGRAPSAAPAAGRSGSVRARCGVGGVGVSAPPGARPSALTFICHCPQARAAPPGAFGARRSVPAAAGVSELPVRTGSAPSPAGPARCARRSRPLLTAQPPLTERDGKLRETESSGRL